MAEREFSASCNPDGGMRGVSSWSDGRDDARKPRYPALR